MSRLRVGLNLVFLNERSGGVGRAAGELLAALSRRDDVEVHAFTSSDEPPALRERVAGVRWTRLPARTSGPPVHLLASYGAVPLMAMRRRLDVLHSPANAGPVRVPGVVSVITVHDVLWLQAAEQWDTATAVARMRRVAEPTIRRADRLTTVSKDARNALISLLGVDPARVDVVPNGVRGPTVAATTEATLRQRLGLGERRVLLCVAQKRPYKNQEAILRALPLLPEDVALVLPGTPTTYEERLRDLAAVSGRQVLFPDWVSEEDLEGLYAMASCCVLPSRFEGFGLPALEAMARGVPVVAADRSALPEVVGDAGLLGDVDDPPALAGMIRRVLEAPALAEDLAQRGSRRSAAFTWDRTAELTVGAYHRALEVR